MAVFKPYEKIKKVVDAQACSDLCTESKENGNDCQYFNFKVHPSQGVKVVMLGRQNERNSSYVRLAHTTISGLCFMTVFLMKSNCYSLIYSSLDLIHMCSNEKLATYDHT